MDIMSKIPLSEVGVLISDFRNIYALIVDSKISQALADLALQHKVKYLVGTGYKEVVRAQGLQILTLDDLRAPEQD
jgi:hypothetical protein